MPSFFSAATKTAINQVFADLHESYGQTITAFKDGQKISISSDPSYNPYYGGASNITYEVQSETFMARIKYISADEEMFLERDGVSANNSQLKIILPAGSVRLKVDSAGWDYIKGAKKVEFNGNRYSIVSNGRPIGPFDVNYYIVYLTPTDE